MKQSLMRLNPKKIALSGAITLFWLFGLALLINTHYGIFPVGKASGAATMPEELFGEKWTGIYKGDQKIGYGSSRLEKTGEGYKAFESSLMRIKLLGEEKEIKTLTEAYLDTGFRLSSFTAQVDSDVVLRISGRVEGKTLLISLDIGGMKSEQKIPLKEIPYLGLPALPGLEPGSSVRLPVFDPATLVEDEMELKVEGKERLKVMGSELDVLKLEGSFKGASLTIWMTEKGEMMKEEFAGLIFMRETKEEAMELGGNGLGGPDFALDSAIPAEGNRPPEELSDKGLSYLKVRLKGIAVGGFDLDGGSQSLSGDVLEVWRPDIDKLKGPGAPLTDPDFNRAEYLKETLFIQTKDPEIEALSKEITKGAKDDIEKARLIYGWVYKNINKTPAATMPSAREVLKSRRGDCNEHTTLYTALSRVAGVPARVAVGLFYKGGYFYYHAWPEVYITLSGGGSWVPVDPTLGQFPADAGRIRLLVGDIDRQVGIISVLGKLRVEIIEFK